jgi:hypothetical protein
VLIIEASTPPPPSRINGRGVDTNGDTAVDAIEFTQAGGATTRLTPFVQDPTIDTFLAEQFELSAAAGFPVTTQRYAEILGVLEHVSGSLVLPYVQCRVGGYEFTDTAYLRPFADLQARWQHFGQYRTCVNNTMSTLEAKRLYDKQLGKQVVFTEEILGLFGH